MMNEPSSVMARLRLEQRAKSGANWFYWIAGLSLINSLSFAAGSRWHFIAGLGMTQFIDAFVSNASSSLRVVGFLGDLAVAAMFVAIGYIARTQNAGFLVGLILYSLDAFIFLALQEWLGLAFHVFVLFSVFTGYSAFRLLRPPVLSPQQSAKLSAPPPQVRPEDLNFRD